MRGLAAFNVAFVLNIPRSEQDGEFLFQFDDESFQAAEREAVQLRVSLVAFCPWRFGSLRRIIAKTALPNSLMRYTQDTRCNGGQIFLYASGRHVAKTVHGPNKRQPENHFRHSIESSHRRKQRLAPLVLRRYSFEYHFVDERQNPKFAFGTLPRSGCETRNAGRGGGRHRGAGGAG
jgi:hypothetical protein